MSWVVLPCFTGHFLGQSTGGSTAESVPGPQRVPTASALATFPLAQPIEGAGAARTVLPDHPGAPQPQDGL